MMPPEQGDALRDSGGHVMLDAGRDTAPPARDNPVAFDEGVRALYDGLPVSHRMLIASVLAQDLADAQREFEALTARLATVRARRDAFQQRLDYLKRISDT
jgi:hypothetical protein